MPDQPKLRITTPTPRSASTSTERTLTPSERAEMERALGIGPDPLPTHVGPEIELPPLVDAAPPNARRRPPRPHPGAEPGHLSIRARVLLPPPAIAPKPTVASPPTAEPAPTASAEGTSGSLPLFPRRQAPTIVDALRAARIAQGLPPALAFLPLIQAHVTACMDEGLPPPSPLSSTLIKAATEPKPPADKQTTSWQAHHAAASAEPPEAETWIIRSPY